MPRIVGPVIPDERGDLPSAGIHWPGLQHDLTAFPDDGVLYARRSQATCDRTPLMGFVRAVEDAQQRVWLLDPYFGQPEADERPGQLTLPERLVDAFCHSRAASIRFVTGHHDGSLNEIVVAYANPGQDVGWLTMQRDAFPYAHDRFAIVDGELWHFGATVGGGHSSLTAATRGWCAVQTGAADFFKRVWIRLGGRL